MAADGGLHCKETNQGMHGLAVSWLLCFNSPDQIVAEVRRMNQAMGQITGGLNNAFGQVRTDAQKISVKGWHRSMNNWSMFIENWEYWSKRQLSCIRQKLVA